MGFHDLPADWPTRPVTDPLLTADILDLLVGERDRHGGAVGVLLCGDGARLLQPVVISGPPAEPSAEEQRAFFDTMCQALGDPDRPGSGAGLLVAVARPGSPFVSRVDRSWQEAAEWSCAGHGLALHGVWLMTPQVIRPISRDGRGLRSA